MTRPARTPLPPWLKVPLPSGPAVARIRAVCQDRGLHTVCASAKCPNLGECWGAGTATFMILGGLCTRTCRFCAVASMARPPAPSPQEPDNLARTVTEMNLRYAVLTTVCRDDLPDQGSGHIAACVAAVKRKTPKTLLEILLQDFRGEGTPLKTILASGPDVIGHNLETVERISSRARDPRSGYRLSLSVLAALRRLAPKKPLKSSLMLGLGETDEEITAALRDLRDCGVDLLTLGQYLRPTGTHRHLAVARFVTPGEFDHYAQTARGMGFAHVSSGPFVRSSYKAAEAFAQSILNGTQK